MRFAQKTLVGWMGLRTGEVPASRSAPVITTKASKAGSVIRARKALTPHTPRVWH
jgi:hypothetical protein